MPKKKTKTPKAPKKKAPAKNQRSEKELSPEELDGVTGGALISTEWVFVASVADEGPEEYAVQGVWHLRR
jgi:hypothetical protein